MIINVDKWQRPSLDANAQIETKVATMLSQIRTQGDSAIEKFSLEFDQTVPEVIPLKPFDEYQLDSKLAESIQFAASRIEQFAKFQKEGINSKSFSDEYGAFGQVVSPIERIGAYIPGGRYPLISTALMTLIPAKIAGCSIRIACSPSTNPALLAAASLAGATQFIQVGGVQAIGALAYGYNQQSAVDLIAGPGNAWVNEAKKQVQSLVKIDGLAGPSELLALCDKHQPVNWLALDALAQAEHDPLACSLIASDSAEWLESLLNYLKSNSQFKPLIDNQQIQLIYAESKEQLIQFSESYAAEHLMLCHAKISAEELTNYGSLFIGADSAVALGDYISGPNHTLPTSGYARQTGGLSVNTFLRILTVQQVNQDGRVLLANKAMPIADAEGLTFHYDSLKART